MAWGIETPDKKFYPIMFVRNFYVAPQQSGDFSGEVELNNCDMVIGPSSGITNNSVRITGDVTGELIFESITSGDIQNLLRLYPKDHYEQPYGGMRMLDNILFFKNQAGSNSLKLGGTNNYCLFTDTGSIFATDYAYLDGGATIGGSGDYGVAIHGNSTLDDGDFTVLGNVHANNISSDKRYKRDIKDTTASGLEKIMQIKHKQFIKDVDNKHYDIGYIAQDMEKIDPNFVLINENSKDRQYYINELPIVATLTKAIQEQQAQIEELKQEIKSLKGEK